MMAHDNSERFRYIVVREVIIPKENGGMERLHADTEVVGPHYEKFVASGALRKIELPVPAKEQEPSTDVPKKEEAAKASDEASKETSEEEQVDKMIREDLECMTKKKLLKFAPAFRGTKVQLIDHILGE